MSPEKKSAAGDSKLPAVSRKPPAAKKASAKAVRTPKRDPNASPAVVRKPRLKDPSGGLTAAGRKSFAEKDGSRLRPGVQGPADTPEKMKRKGSFLTRHFTHPRGPMIKDGEPTRLALSAHAWGEPVPKTLAAAERLAAKGRKLLEQYHKAQARTKPAEPEQARRSARASVVKR